MKNNAHLIFNKGVLVFAAVLSVVCASCSSYVEDRAILNPSKNEISTASTANPVAQIDTPAFFEGGVPQNRSLIISFSKPMNTQTFWEKLILTDSMGKNLKDNFCLPVWSNEDTLVEIAPNPENPINLKNKTSFDIYVTISNNVTDKDGKALHNPIDYRYRINESVDEEVPEIIKIDSMDELEEGALSAKSIDAICNANHINSNTDFYFEGKDSGDGDVWAKFIYKRIYDVTGAAIEAEEYSKLIKLNKQSVSETWYDTVSFDLSDSRYADGMYEVFVYIADASGNLSSDFNTYYIIRDTSVCSNPNTSVSFETIEDEEEPLTKARLDYYTNLITFENLDNDIYFTMPAEDDDEPLVYSTDKKDFSYTVCWGLSLTSLSEPVKLTGNDSGYELSQSYKNFRNRNLDKDIYLSVTYTDAVGNSNTINTVVPHVIDFFNYEVQEGSEEDLKKIKLNFAQLTTTSTKFADMPEKQGSVSYRIYYGLYEDDADKETTELQATDSSLESYDYDFEIEDNSVYLVYIQPVYSITSKTNGQWCGNTLGPLYELEANTISSGEDPGHYSFTVSKTSDGINTGTFTIDVDIQNGERDVKYYPCFSTDGKNWSTYNVLSFQVDNPLRAPVKAGELWAKSDIWNEKSFFEARKELEDDYSNVVAKVRILAVKGNKAVYSKPQELVFTVDEDNIPPEASTDITSHDSMLSFDGRSFKFEGLIKEDDLNTNEIFKYYYTEYDEKWGNNLFFMTDEQIKALSGAVSRIEAKVWKTSDSSLEYSLSPVVPVNGLKDGKYMFFARVKDSYGNESYITLGKAQIGTFKNKLKVNYDSTANQFNSVLALSDYEAKLSRSMINIQAFDTESGWYNYYGEQNELVNCNVDSRTKTLSNNAKNIKKGTFYRLSVQSFNDNTYNPETNTGVNKINPRPYSEQSAAGKVVPVVQNETEYDLYTEETVSNAVYYYVPAQDEDMSKFKGSFFKNTVAISTNKPVIINLISSLKDLGSDIDEWERRGKLIKTYYFKGDSSGIPFKDNDVREDMLNSDEIGLVYYVMVVHFANNTSEISNVYKLVK